MSSTFAIQPLSDLIFPLLRKIERNYDTVPAEANEITFLRKRKRKFRNSLIKIFMSYEN